MGMDREIAPIYIRTNFEPSDHLAVLVLNKRIGMVTQRISTAERIAEPDYQAWLRHQNAQRSEIYISMNVLHDWARGRTKNEVAAIRHVYLDLDENGGRALYGLSNREDVPQPSQIINTSPGKWQVIWRVDDFGKNEAEALQKGLAREIGADPAATDCARVLRLPGFYNHKYGRPYPVSAAPRFPVTGLIYRPKDFPKFPDVERDYQLNLGEPVKLRPGELSQSERDWAYAKRALSRGEPVDSIIAAIAEHRRNEKPNPKYYAMYTVQKAAAVLAHKQLRALNLAAEPER
jgi:hypothetical protein